MQDLTLAQAYDLALQHHNAGRLLEAQHIYRQILAIQPAHVGSLHHLGVVAYQFRRYDLALELITRAIHLDPGSTDANNNLGNVLRDTHRLDEAIAAYQRAIACNPNYAQAHCNLGVVLIDKGQVETAIECYRRAIALNPKYAEAHFNLANALLLLGRFDEAIPGFRSAIGHRPDFADAHKNLGMTLLLKGDLSEGWLEYEWRLKTSEFAGLEPLPQPLWNGVDLQGRTLLLRTEQGHGDTLQFIRYAPIVARRGGHIVIQCRPELQRLLQTSLPEAAILKTGEPLPAFDVHCPLMSLPRIFATTLETIPGKVPYLRADPALTTSWQQRLVPHAGKLKVGLVWAGSPTQKDDANRSINLATYAPLAALPNTHFFALQKGEVSKQANDPPPGMPLTDCAPMLEDFADTAALISNLDLVISVCTSVAHLTGALGKPAWTLLWQNADWRWLQTRSDSPWYPSMKLFRQTRLGDWENVILRVREALLTYDP